VVVLADGAAWIWLLADEHLGERVEIVDFYHASEHVWALAHAFFGEGSYLAAPWAHVALSALRYEGATSLLRLLADIAPATPMATEALRRETHSFRTHQARMDYPAYWAKGLPLGSGGVESAGKHLVQMRMKRAGARWSDEGGTGVLGAPFGPRCRLVSDRPPAA